MDYLIYLLIVSLLAILGRLPLGVVFRLGKALGFFTWIILPKYRRLARHNIRVALGQSLTEELDDKEGTNLLKKMKDDRTSFLKAHAANGLNDRDISDRLKTMQTIPSVLSLPKREAEEETEELETKVSGKKSNKKSKKHH